MRRASFRRDRLSRVPPSSFVVRELKLLLRRLPFRVCRLARIIARLGGSGVHAPRVCNAPESSQTVRYLGSGVTQVSPHHGGPVSPTAAAERALHQFGKKSGKKGLESRREQGRGRATIMAVRRSAAQTSTLQSAPLPTWHL